MLVCGCRVTDILLRKYNNQTSNNTNWLFQFYILYIDGHESKPANSNFSKKNLFDKFEGNTFLHNVLKNLVPSMSLYPSFRQLTKPAISHSDTFQRNKTG